MQIMLDTDRDSYEGALATVRAAFGVKDPPSKDGAKAENGNGEGKADDDDDYLPGKWNRKRLTKFGNWLANDAAEAVRYIANNAPAVPIDDTIAHMGKHLGIKGMTGQQMGGRMASIGFSWKAIPGVSGPPLDTDYKHRMYRMDEGIAAVLAEVLGPPSST